MSEGKLHETTGSRLTLTRGIMIFGMGTVGALAVSKARVSSQGKEKTHKHKQICGIVPGLGGAKNLFMCFFFGSFLMGEKKHINKIPPKIPGQSRENFVYVFCSLCVFFAPQGLHL